MKRPQTIAYCIHEEAPYYVAQCIDALVDIASFGASETEAIAHLKEAVDLHFDDGAERLLERSPSGSEKRTVQPGLPSSQDVDRVLMDHGFVPVSQRGRWSGHQKYRHASLVERTTIVPVGRATIPRALLATISHQTSIPLEWLERRSC